MSTNQPDSRPAEPARDSGLRRRILIVDDERDFLAMVALTLQQTGRYEVRGESDARRAVDVARQFRPEVVLLDVMMPELDGGDVAQALQADPATRHIPIIYLTALVARQEAPNQGPLRSGGHCYLPKPIELAELDRRLRQALADSAGMPAQA
jgi:CheY-like chemotaxis protein